MNTYVSEAAIPHIGAIRYCTLQKILRIRVPTFRYLGGVLQCTAFPHTPAHHTLRSRLPFFHFSWSIYHQIAFETRPVTFSSGEAKSRETVPPAGRLQRSPLTSRGGVGVAASPRPVFASPKPPVHWSGPVYKSVPGMMQPVGTERPRATRAQPYLVPFLSRFLPLRRCLVPYVTYFP